ncbi:MAG: hypothetical protein HY850_08340 [Betaproteobacteria bacterium]|nr:hypothetical protein [Betaproteobacteria bacterium]
MRHWKFLRIPYFLTAINYGLLFLIEGWADSNMYFGVNAALIIAVGYQAVRRNATNLWAACLYGTSIIGVVSVLGIIVIIFFDWANPFRIKIQGLIGYLFSMLVFVPVAMVIASIGGLLAKAMNQKAE